MKSVVYKIIPNEKITDEEVRKSGVNLYVFGVCVMAKTQEEAEAKIAETYPDIKLVRKG